MRRLSSLTRGLKGWVIVLGLGWGFPALADEPAPSEEAAPGAVSCLERSIAGELGQDNPHKGVQKRDFLKRRRFEISALGGFSASDVLSSTYTYGGALTFYPSEDFGVEAFLSRSPVEFRLEQPFSAFDRERHFTPGTAWRLLGALLFSPIHAKLKFGEKILHSDMFFLAGAGRTDHGTSQGLTWQVGAGFKIYLGNYFALRLELRDFILAEEVLGRGRVAQNLSFLLGVSLWLPG